MGEDVRALQKFLNAQGFIVVPSGEETTYFGPATAAALARYQEAHRAEILTPNGLARGTGIFGPATLAFITGKSVGSFVSGATATSNASPSGITRSLRHGFRGTDIAVLQRYLIAKGYLSTGNDTGYFGDLTRAAVRQFQCATLQICSGDETSTGWGFVGARTRAALN